MNINWIQIINWVLEHSIAAIMTGAIGTLFWWYRERQRQRVLEPADNAQSNEFGDLTDTSESADSNTLEKSKN